MPHPFAVSSRKGGKPPTFHLLSEFTYIRAVQSPAIANSSSVGRLPNIYSSRCTMNNRARHELANRGGLLLLLDGQIEFALRSIHLLFAFSDALAYPTPVVPQRFRLRSPCYQPGPIQPRFRPRVQVVRRLPHRQPDRAEDRCGTQPPRLSRALRQSCC